MYCLWLQLSKYNKNNISIKEGRSALINPLQVEYREKPNRLLKTEFVLKRINELISQLQAEYQEKVNQLLKIESVLDQSIMYSWDKLS